LADCVFDPIARGEAPAHLVLDRGPILGFLDIRPVFPGHVLVIPKEHYPTLAELPAELLAPLLAAGRDVVAAQRQVLGSAGAFLGLNEVVSQSVPHVHLHVVPRRFKDGLRGFFWPRHAYEDPEAAARLAASLRQALEDGPRSL
jgi:histidine triad (HIT) family protein